VNVLYQIVNGFISFYTLLILVYVLMSWIRPSGGLLEVYRVLGTLVEPYLGLFRRIMPSTGMIDLSPLVGLLVLEYVVRPILLTLLGRL
jgi:YggT family protein